MSDIVQNTEDFIAFRQKPSDYVKNIFKTGGSAGANPKKLAQIVTVLDFAFDVLGWDDISFSTIITANQASISAKYHNDFKEISIATEKANANRNNGILSI